MEIHMYTGSARIDTSGYSRKIISVNQKVLEKI